MEQNNRQPKQYSGTRGLSWAVVIGVAIGTVIGKLMDNMNTGLMIGLVVGVMGWVLLVNRRQAKGGAETAESATRKEAPEDRTQSAEKG